ncbi:MAG: ferritin family protein [Firmicutes bacterium]|nr:ferritin family protein [Bacillota bacterium]
MAVNELNLILDKLSFDENRPDESIRHNYSGYEIVLLAIEIEKMGHMFYTRAEKLAITEEVKEMFRTMAKEELDHIKIINREIEPMFKNEDDYTWENEENVSQYLTRTSGGSVFANPDSVKKLLEQVDTHEEAVELCLKGEKKAIAFYKKVMDQTSGEEGKTAIKRILDEEIKHVERLENLRKNSF